MRSLAFALVALLFLSACQHSVEFTAPDDRCKFVRYSLETPLPDEKPLRGILEGNPGNILVLSGGSQDGAFGAGFIDGWHASGRMPEFKLVTGISTGALQATGAFIGRPEIAIDGYTINDEEELLDTYVDGSDIDPEFNFGAIFQLLTRGSVSDLVPLRDELKRLLTTGVLEAVGAKYDPAGKGAHLLVGATDVDLGRAVAFDMTELAWRYKESTDTNVRARLKDCYIRALIASSIVPPAAKPMAIDNRLYIDGGVRYAVFDDRLGEILGDMSAGAPVARSAAPPDTPVIAAPTPAPAEQKPGMYLILNHTGESRAVCEKEDEADCEPINSTLGQRKDWEVLGLAVRTLELFEAQIRRLSVERAAERARNGSMPFFFARIRAGDRTSSQHTYSIPDFEAEGEKTCAAWETIDNAEDDPVEFHKRYMRCMIEYGRARGVAADWEPLPQP